MRQLDGGSLARAVLNSGMVCMHVEWLVDGPVDAASSSEALPEAQDHHKEGN